MQPHSPLPTQKLLEQVDWVRRLARSLVFDPNRADDVVQETLRAALESPPREVADLRSWLAVVVRNAVRGLGRSEARRRVREAQVARAEAGPDTADVIAKTRLQRRVVDAVLELDEPYRTTLLLRYFEELRPAAIAQRLGRPVNTVRTHLERGHERLRQALDEEFGSREAWGVACLPLLRKPPGLGLPVALFTQLGGIAMLLKVGLVTSLALVGWLAWSGGQAGVPGDVLPRMDREVPSVALKSSERSARSTATAEFSDRQEVPRSPDEPDTPATPAKVVRALTSLSGRVVDMTGSPVARVKLEFRPSPNHGPPGRVFEGLTIRDESAADGAFQVQLPFESWDVQTSDSSRTIVGSARSIKPDGGRELVLLLANIVPLAGRVLTPAGQPAEGAKVTASVSLKGIHGFALALEEHAPKKWQLGTTDSFGEFRAASLPDVPGMTLTATLGKQEAYGGLDSSRTRDDVTLRLKDPVEKHIYEITGRVFEANGAPAQGVRIMFSQELTQTDASGSFTMNVSYLVSESQLFATTRGMRPAILSGLVERLKFDPLAGQGLSLHLGGATGVLRGRVVDESGKPCPTAKVLLMDSTGFGMMGHSLENELDGRSSRRLEVDSEGRFSHGGLIKPDYLLRAYLPESFQAAELTVRSDAAGEVVLMLSSQDLIPRLQGTVVDSRGVPVPNVALGLSMVVSAVASGSQSIGRQLGVSAADGSFEFDDVPCLGVTLSARVPGGRSTLVRIGKTSVQPLKVVVGVPMTFQIDPERFRDFGCFEVRDQDGERMTLRIFTASATSLYSRMSLKPGATWPNYEVTDSAAELVFYHERKDEQPALRVPITLQRGKVTVVR